MDKLFSLLCLEFLIFLNWEIFSNKQTIINDSLI